MKLRTLAAALAFGALATQPALAGEESGFYLGGSVGNAELDISGLDDDTGYKVFGGYNFGLIPLVDLGIEASYMDFGSQGASAMGESLELSTTGLSAHGLAGLTFGPFGVFAKAGMMNWDADLKSTFGDDSDSGTDPAYGVGLKFQLSSFQLRAEYELIDLDGTDMEFYSLGAAYTF